MESSEVFKRDNYSNKQNKLSLIIKHYRTWISRDGVYFLMRIIDRSRLLNFQKKLFFASLNSWNFLHFSYIDSIAVGEQSASKNNATRQQLKARFASDQLMNWMVSFQFK